MRAGLKHSSQIRHTQKSGRTTGIVIALAVIGLLPESAPAAEPTGSFSGTIILDGDAPALKPLVKKGQETLKDREVCGLADIADESIVVGNGNGIANVFVFLRRAPKGYKSNVPSEPVVLDQKECTFLPHAAVVQAGQKVLVKSSDPIQHNVHTFPKRNNSINLLLKPNEQTGVEVVYRTAEAGPIQVKCDIHSWMSSYHLVLDHPFMAVTDADGQFTIDNLPAGKHSFRVWHERGQLLENDLKVDITGDNEPVTLKYTADQLMP